MTKGYSGACKAEASHHKADPSSAREGQTSADARRHQRQSHLLDDALLETFPTSEAISIVHLQ